MKQIVRPMWANDRGRHGRRPNPWPQEFSAQCAPEHQNTRGEKDSKLYI